MEENSHWGAPLRLGIGLGQAERQFPESSNSEGGQGGHEGPLVAPTFLPGGELGLATRAQKGIKS